MVHSYSSTKPCLLCRLYCLTIYLIELQRAWVAMRQPRPMMLNKISPRHISSPHLTSYNPSLLIPMILSLESCCKLRAIPHCYQHTCQVHHRGSAMHPPKRLVQLHHFFRMWRAVVALLSISCFWLTVSCISAFGNVLIASTHPDVSFPALFSSWRVRVQVDSQHW